MVEIAKCRMCGRIPRAKIVRNEVVRPHYLSCANLDCGVDGPLRHTEAEAIWAWNALMSPAPEPAPGAVRVRIPVHEDNNEWNIGWTFSTSNKYDYGRGRVAAYITADLPLRTELPEISGTVEASGD